MTAQLFQPWTLRSVTVPNRVVLSPMCQYSAEDGSATDWHMAHLAQYAMGGVGLTFIEATHVSAQGRITPHCLGLYSDDNERSLARVIAAFRAISDAPLAIQLNHSGRKGSAQVPWEGGAPLGGDDAWPTLAPSPLPHGDGWPVPQELDADGMQQIKWQFVDAARRARAPWHRGRRAARCPRLPAAQLPVTGIQPPQRWVWRQSGKAHALSVGGVRGNPCRLAG